MRAEALLWGLLASGCVSTPYAPGRGGALHQESRVGWPPSPSNSGPRGGNPLWRHVGSRVEATQVGAGRGPQVALARRAVLKAIDEVKQSMERSEAMRSQLASRSSARGGRSLGGAFTRYLDHGANQRAWLREVLGSATALAGVASEVEDSDMELGVLRMAGPRLQGAMFGALLLATWVDFLQLADALLRDCPMYGTERLFADLHRVQGLMEPALKELASGDPERVEVAAAEMPELMGRLSHEFDTIHRDARSAMEVGGKVMVAVQVMEMLALVSTLKMSLPRPPPAAPATLGMGLVMSSGGVMAGSQLVVSAEWVEMMRRLVQAGVISLPVVSAAVRIHGGQVMMAQAHQDLPEGVREALGDSPEVRGMHVTGRAGAGMSEAPKHHVMPKEHREWFEARGFKGDMDIDNFCVRLERSHHEAIHGGGNWKLGRTWPGEWSRMIMEALHEAEVEAGRMLTRNEALNIVASRMKRYDVPMKFTKGSSR
ncbi:TIGR02269 family lipoprotein [Myxococcus sp. K38C18041901]|nr:TIGR02269 family lipoprotein [Myxococcus guangdongensis]